MTAVDITAYTAGVYAARIGGSVLRWFLPRRRSAALALVLVTVVVGDSMAVARGQHNVRHLDTFAFILLILPSVAIAFHDRWPMAVWAMSLAALIGYWGLNYPYGPAPLPVLVALYAVAASGGIRRAVTVWTATIGALLALKLNGQGGDSLPVELIMDGGWAAAALLLGYVVRDHRLAAKAARAQAVREERVRIARELHDVISHGIAMINVQAQAASLLFERDPGAARAALGTIRQASKEALRELRTTLDMLRQDGDAESREPTADLGQLPSLLGIIENTQVNTCFTAKGTPRPLPPAVSLTAYRVIQEALTNVVKHAGRPVNATVSLGYEPRCLVIDVADDGKSATGPAGATAAAGTHGFGLKGMRERVTALGGTFAAGPRDPSGFAVHARVPVEEHIP
jgi:signal transduction histidine kinase